MADTEQTALAKTNDNIQEVSVESVQSDIKSLIYVVRNQQIMVDSDLAMLYQVETKRLYLPVFFKKTHLSRPYQ